MGQLWFKITACPNAPWQALGFVDETEEGASKKPHWWVRAWRWYWRNTWGQKVCEPVWLWRVTMGWGHFALVWLVFLVVWAVVSSI